MLRLVATLLFAASIVPALLVAEWPMLPLAAGIIAALTTCAALCLAQKAWTGGRFAPVLALVMLCAMLFVAFSSLQLAGIDLLNAFIAAWDAQMDAYVLQIAAPAPSELDLLLFALFIGIASGLITYAAYAKSSVALAAIVCAIALVPGIFLCLASPLPAACLLGATTILISCFAAESPHMGIGKKASSRSLIIESDQNEGRVIRPFAVVTVLLLVISLLAGNAFPGNAFLANMKSWGTDASDEALLGSDSLPQGKLTQSYLMNRTPSTGPTSRLEVSFAQQADVRELYLRGFTGSVYTGTEFTPMQATGYEGDWSGLFSWLDSRWFNPLAQYAVYEQLNTGEGANEIELTPVTVDVQQAYRKYAYAPVTANVTSGPGALLDLYRTNGLPLGNSSSDFAIANGVEATELIIPGDWLYESSADFETASAELDSSNSTPTTRESARAAFATSERAYRAFVYDRYLDLDEAVRPAIGEFFFEGGDWDGEKTLFSISTRIRTMLDASCDYRSSGASYKGGDYVTSFLEESHVGNAVAFASAAVLAYRYEGIPARYVEGYLLDKDTVASMASSGSVTATLTEENAHAWVEIYVDGAGWLPVEMTPGFYSPLNASGEVIEIAREVAGTGGDDPSLASLDNEDDWSVPFPEQLRPFAWLGLIVLFVLLLLIIWGLLELQCKLRLKTNCRRREHAFEAGAASVPLFKWLSSRLEDADIDIDPRRPVTCAEALSIARPEIHPDEFRRVIALLERERYGAQRLRRFELEIVEGLCVKLEAGNWERASIPKRFKYHYLHLYRIPLRRVTDQQPGRTRGTYSG